MASPQYSNLPSRKRLKQVEAWLIENFPVGMPVSVRVHRFGPVDSDDHGFCFRSDDRKTLKIRINKVLPLYGQIEILMHEWAHAIVWPDIHHSDKFGLTWVKIYREWWDNDGCIKSMKIRV